MKETWFSYERLAKHAARRPANYLEQIDACVVRRDGRGIWVDAHSPCWVSLMRLYEAARKGTVTSGVFVPDAVVSARAAACAACECNVAGVCKEFQRQRGKTHPAEVSVGIRVARAKCPLPQPKWEAWEPT